MEALAPDVLLILGPVLPVRPGSPGRKRDTLASVRPPPPYTPTVPSWVPLHAWPAGPAPQTHQFPVTSPEASTEGPPRDSYPMGRNQDLPPREGMWPKPVAFL